MTKSDRQSIVIELDIHYTRVVSVKLDVSLIKRIDDLCEKHHYKNRSEFIREAIMLYLAILQKFGRVKPELILKKLDGLESKTPLESESSRAR